MSKNPLAASALNPRSWSPPATAASSFLSTMLPSAPSLASPAVSTAQSCHRVMGWHPCAAGPCHQALSRAGDTPPWVPIWMTLGCFWSALQSLFGALGPRPRGAPAGTPGRPAPAWRALCPLQSAPAGPGFLGGAQLLPRGAREPKFCWAGGAVSLGLRFLAGEGRQ